MRNEFLFERGKKMLDINKPVTNPKLVAILKKIKEEYSSETEHLLYQLILAANYLTPVNISPSLEKVNGKSVLKEDTKIEFMGLHDNDGKQYIPAFTDWQELKKWGNSNNQQTVVLKFKEYEEMILDGKTWSGLVINPFGENIIIDKDRLKIVNKHAVRIEKDESVMLGIPEEYPDEMVSAIREVLPEVESVKSAYLLLMIRNKTDKSYLIVVDTDSNPQAVFEKIAKVAQTYLKDEEKIDFVPLSNSFGENAVRDHEPFYRK